MYLSEHMFLFVSVVDKAPPSQFMQCPMKSSAYKALTSATDLCCLPNLVIQ